MEYKALRARARENLRGNWGISIGAALLAAMLGALTVNSSGLDISAILEEQAVFQFPSFVVAILSAWLSIAGTVNIAQFILGGVVQLGYARFLLKQHDRQSLSISDLFSQFDRFGAGFLQAFLRNLYVTLWSLLFIIPGIVKNYSYAMTPFIMADHPEMTAKQAINASREMMDGYKGDLFMLHLTFIGWDLLAMLTLGIGSLWLNPYMNAANAAFYQELLAQQRYTTVE